MKKTRPPGGASKGPVAPKEGGRAPTYDDLLAIARLVEAGSRFTEFRLRSGDIEVEVKRAVAPEGPAPVPASSAPGTHAVPESAAETELPAGTHLVRSPMAGTAYRSPLPGAPAYVEPGSRVEADTIVCIVEVMKLMNSVTAGVAGEVTHILFGDARPVAPGQALVAIREAP